MRHHLGKLGLSSLVTMFSAMTPQMKRASLSVPSTRQCVVCQPASRQCVVCQPTSSLTAPSSRRCVVCQPVSSLTMPSSRHRQCVVCLPVSSLSAPSNRQCVVCHPVSSLTASPSRENAPFSWQTVVCASFTRETKSTSNTKGILAERSSEKHPPVPYLGRGRIFSKLQVSRLFPTMMMTSPRVSLFSTSPKGTGFMKRSPVGSHIVEA